MPVTMQAPKDCGGISIGGVSYTISKKGLVKVPDASVREMLDFGFTVAAPDDSMDPDAAAAYLAAQGIQDAVQQGNAEIAELNRQEAERMAQLDAINQIVTGS